MNARFLRQAAFVARKDLAYTLRAKEALFWVFAMPVLFIGFIGAATGGSKRGTEAAPREPIALRAPENGGFLLDELVRRLDAERFDVHGEPAGEGEPLLVVPEPTAEHASFTDALLDGETSTLRLSAGDEGLDSSYVRFRVQRAVYGLLADLAAARASGTQPSAESFASLRAMPRSVSLSVHPAGARREIPSGFEQSALGTLVMFTMLVLLTSGAILLVIERESGLLRRMAATPIPRGAIVLGKWAGKLGLGLVQIAFAAAVGTILFGVEWGRAPFAVALLLVAWAAFNASLGLLLAGLARSQAQMSGIGVIASLALAALGGCWWPIEITPSWMQAFAKLLPTGWAMGGLHAFVSFGRGPLAALPATALLLGGAALLGWAAAKRFRFV